MAEGACCGCDDCFSIRGVQAPGLEEETLCLNIFRDHAFKPARGRLNECDGPPAEKAKDFAFCEPKPALELCDVHYMVLAETC